jgi:GTPase SAR1 family protein
MLKRQQSKSTTISEFYQGDNIMSHLTNSLFGKIKKIYEQDKTNKLYQLPKVIVIGTESSGKSSLLERITKCQLFPSDSKLCTKCPIKVKLENGKPSYSIQLPGDTIQQLENKKDIYPIVQNYMNSLSNDIIYKDEIIINITDIDVPDFEFYDLPGIRTYPQNVADLSVNICKKYLSDKNSIVLCVVPCTTTRLTSCQSIALIKEAKMEHNTILVLTMTDRLQEDDISELLINRIIDKTDELNGIKFANCLAVVNRSQYTNYSLEESDQKEKEWFDENIYECIFREQIIMNTSISNLLKSMDNLYNHFIKTDWIPRMINEMRIKEDTIKKELKSLEPVITKENFPEFKSLCLSCGIVQIEQVPTKYFIGVAPVMPYTFFESLALYIPVESEMEIVFDMIGTYYNNGHYIIPNGREYFRDDTIFISKNDKINIINALFKINNKRGSTFFSYNCLYYNIQLIENIFSNFYDIIKIKYVLKDNIFNIPIKRFININTKFDKLFLKYIKQLLNKNILEVIKRNLIDCLFRLHIGDSGLCGLCSSFPSVFIKAFELIIREGRLNDFIVENLTIDFFAESEEDKIKLESELKIISSNIYKLDEINKNTKINNEFLE